MSLAESIARATKLASQPSSLAGFGVICAGVHTMATGDYATGIGLMMTGMGAVLVPEASHTMHQQAGHAVSRHKPRQVSMPERNRAEDEEYDYEYAEEPDHIRSPAHSRSYRKPTHQPEHKQTATERFAGAIKESMTPKLMNTDGCFSPS